MDRDSFFRTWSSLHGDAEIAGVVKGWLRISFRIAQSLHKLRITPNILTSIGVISAVILWPLAKSYWAIPVLALSLLADGVDGSLAIIRQSTSKWGALIDSFADRISEVFWALACYRLGVDIRIVFIVWAAAATQEYIRARAGGLGLKEIGVVTICERPVRASLLCIALAGFELKIHIVTAVVVVWAAMQSVALAQLSISAFRRLKLR